jgi:hypothetical protein
MPRPGQNLPIAGTNPAAVRGVPVQIRRFPSTWGRSALRLKAPEWGPTSTAYDAARSLARCIAIVQEDEQATKDERAKQAAFYGDEAMQMLKGAVAKAYKDAAHMKADKDLHPLRERDDFKKLLAEVEGKK